MSNLFYTEGDRFGAPNSVRVHILNFGHPYFCLAGNGKEEMINLLLQAGDTSHQKPAETLARDP